MLTVIADPPRLCAGARIATYEVQLCVQGEVRRTYNVEASPDLSNWTLIAAPLNTDGTLHFADPARSSYSQRFYRITLEP